MATIANKVQIGDRFGRLIIVELIPGKHRPNRSPKARLKCDCGSETVVATGDLRSGHTRSCGCLRNDTRREQGKMLNRKHGHYQSPTYSSWGHMKQRCLNRKNKKFHLYGGRGITVCDRWQSFENFLADMGERPADKTLDRYPDRNGNYEPANCRWATAKEQSENQVSIGRYKTPNNR